MTSHLVTPHFTIERSHEDMDDFNLDELHDALDDAALIDEIRTPIAFEPNRGPDILIDATPFDKLSPGQQAGQDISRGRPGRLLHGVRGSKAGGASSSPSGCWTAAPTCPTWRRRLAARRASACIRGSRSASGCAWNRANTGDKAELYEWTELLEVEHFGAGHWLRKGKARDAAVTACEQVATFVELLVEESTSDGQQIISVATVEPDSESVSWTQVVERDAGFYYLKRLPDRKIWDEEKKGTMVDTDIGQMKRVRLQAFDGIGKLFTSKDPKQPDNAAFFEMQMELLDEAVTSLLDHIYEQARLDGEPVTSSRAQPVAKLLRESKRRKNELFYLKSTLEAEPEFKVQSLTSHARVPVIRFQYTQGGLDYKWDLCFDNKLGCARAPEPVRPTTSGAHRRFRYITLRAAVRILRVLRLATRLRQACGGHPNPQQTSAEDLALGDKGEVVAHEHSGPTPNIE
ncbi:hypothetical protein ON010_g8753 [Phytophthora cinnamomi]|nr:hypothetical protein ON010_g8753 [Phytophthora cinnamomi]